MTADTTVTCHFKRSRRGRNLKMRVGGFNLNQLGDEEESVLCVVESERNMKRDEGISEREKSDGGCHVLL